MRASILLFFFIIATSASQAQNLDSLYWILDQSITKSNIYIEKKEEKIHNLREALAECQSPEAKYEYSLKLYSEYQPYDDKKAKNTLIKGLDIAKQTGDIDKENRIYSYLAYQNSLGGYYSEALEWLSRVKEENLNRNTAADYYFASTHTYGELGSYTSDSLLSQRYYSLSNQYCAKFFAVADKNSSFYYQRRLSQLLNDRKINEAETLCRKWLKNSKSGSHEQAIMAYYMSECYKSRNDEKMQRYWLTLSALYDCRNAVMDQASLWMLARLLSKDGDLGRSQSYIEYSWTCAQKFGGHTRAWQVSPVITSINDNYREELSKNNGILTFMLCIVSIMVALLLCSLIFVYKRNHQLAVTRNELSKTNEELASLNAQLNGSNEMMNQVNRQLHDSNRVKDEYIARFLSLCSEYIDKMDSYRLKVNRRLKANQYKELLHMTSSDELRDKETKELFANFDAVFLRLYPTFVESFNRLLKPEYHQELGPNSELTTDMRMAALIRLGIDDSAHIAEFMRLSPNTVYNYRARLKSRAAVDRNEFESRIKEIGL